MSSTSPKGNNLKGEFSSSNNSLQDQCVTVIKRFNESQDIIQAGRNTLKKITLNGVICVVKAYRIPKFPQNYSYGILAKSKARKSYDNAKRLLELGFSTPKPIGYFEYRSSAKLTNSYYICEYQAETQTLHSLLTEHSSLSPKLIKLFADYCYRLHQNGILHRDFNPKNILISLHSKANDFSLVDINRITWSKPLSLKESMASLSRLPFDENTTNLLLENYSQLVKADLTQCKTLLRKAEQKTQRYFRNKKRFRKIFPKNKK